MRFLSPAKLLSLLSYLALAFTLITIYGSGLIGVIAVIGISGCMSMMFPTIFGLSVEGLGEDTKIGGSIVIMAIVGGAIITPIQGYISDLAGSIHTSFWIVVVCFIVINYYSRLEIKREVYNLKSN